MLNLVQHLMKLMDYETLKRVQGDMLGVLGQPRCPYFSIFFAPSLQKAYRKGQQELPGVI